MLRRLVSKFNVSFPSEVWPDVDALEQFRGERNRQFTGDRGVLQCRASPAPGAHRCRSHQHEERRGLVGAHRVDPGPGGCRDSAPRRDEKTSIPGRGKTRLRLLVAAPPR